MTDLKFAIEMKWRGSGRMGAGTLKLSGSEMTYSAPESMGGQGVGTSPEELLVAAVSSCYSGTLFAVLNKAGLPVSEVSLRSEGTVTGYPLQSKFAVLCVHPTIHGGDPNRLVDYQRAAQIAQEKCFIGKTIAGNVDYTVGDVCI